MVPGAKGVEFCLIIVDNLDSSVYESPRVTKESICSLFHGSAPYFGIVDASVGCRLKKGIDRMVKKIGQNMITKAQNK